MKRIDAWSQSTRPSKPTPAEEAEAKSIIQREVLKEITLLHKKTPKYEFVKTRPADVIAKYDVDVVPLKGAYVRNDSTRRTALVSERGPYSVEEYACNHFRSLGYRALVVENAPIAVLFAIYMAPVIQDRKDPRNRLVLVW
jgi:hypothetical protein